MFRLTLLLVCACFITQTRASTLRLVHEMGFRGAESLDPISPTRFVLANQMIYDRLVKINARGEVEPQLAKHWQSDSTATRWTFTLREKVFFHDGMPFNAEDVVYTFQRILSPNTQSAVAAVLGIIDQTSCSDERTVTFYLKSPHTEFPVLLADYRIRIVPKQNALDAPVKGVGTGPFRLNKLSPETVTVLTANHQYWDGPPTVNNVHIYGISDYNSRVQALLAGQIDWLEAVSTRQKKLFADHKKLWLQNIRSGEWRGIVFRYDIPPFDDHRIRKAVRIAVDRQKIMQLVSGSDGGELSCDSPVWPGDPYRSNHQCPRNLELAKKLMTEAGYPNGISFDLYTSSIEPEFIPLAEAYQQQAAQAGIRVTIRRVPADSYWQSYWKQVPAMLIRWCQRPADQVLNEIFRSGALWNDTGMAEPEFDQMLDLARSEFQLKKRTSIYHQLQNFLYNNGGTFIPYHNTQVRILSHRVAPFENVEFFGIPWHKIAVRN